MVDSGVVTGFRADPLTAGELWAKYGRTNDGNPISLSESQEAKLDAVLVAAYQTNENIGEYAKVTSAQFGEINSQLRSMELKSDAIMAMLAAHHTAMVGAINQLDNHVGVVNKNIAAVNANLTTMADRMELFFDRFEDYVVQDSREKSLQRAETRIVGIRQQLEQKFGHYKQLRRTATGILQATDIGVVRKNTITNKSEDLMLQTPDYWLAPALVALSAWIDDDRRISDRALAEALKRDDEKTSLFFSLIDRRAERIESAHRWLERYLLQQDAHSVDYKCIIVINAIAAGLFGNDDNGQLTARFGQWLDELNAEAGYADKQVASWMRMFWLLRPEIGSGEYLYLRSFSKSWEPWMDRVLRTSRSYKNDVSWLRKVITAESSSDSVKVQLDRLLSVLVTDFDTAEIPYRKQEERCSIIIDSGGNEKAADAIMAIKDSAFQTRKDFGQLITDAAMNPELAGASATTRRLSVALESDWIDDAFDSIVQDTENNIREAISIDIDTFHDQTTDGLDEDRLVGNLVGHINGEERAELESAAMNLFSQICLVGGPASIIVGLIVNAASRSRGLGVFLLIIGIGGLVYGLVKHHQTVVSQGEIRERYMKKREDCVLALKKLLAEVIKWRQEVDQERDYAETMKKMIADLNPSRYVREIADGLNS